MKVQDIVRMVVITAQMKCKISAKAIVGGRVCGLDVVKTFTFGGDFLLADYCFSRSVRLPSPPLKIPKLVHHKPPIVSISAAGPDSIVHPDDPHNGPRIL
jgi:hypothetical protein